LADHLGTIVCTLIFIKVAYKMVSCLVSLVTKYFYQRSLEMKVDKLGGSFEARISDVISYCIEIWGLTPKLLPTLWHLLFLPFG
jgi:hypothetical protein